MYIKIKCQFFCKSLLQFVDSCVAQFAVLKRMLPVQEQNQWTPRKCSFFNILAFCFLGTAVWTATSLMLHTSKEEIAWPCWLIIVVTFNVCFGNTSENPMKRWMLHPAGYSSHNPKTLFQWPYHGIFHSSFFLLLLPFFLYQLKAACAWQDQKIDMQYSPDKVIAVTSKKVSSVF